MPATQLNEKIENFNNKYKTDLTVDNFGIELKKFKYLDNFLFESLEKNTKGLDYLKLVANYYAKSINNTTAINNEGHYNDVDFGFFEFVNDFEDLSNAHYNYVHNNESNVPQREKYEGAKQSDVYVKIAKTAREINKSLPETWKRQFVDGKITLDNLKALNANATSVLDTLSEQQGENSLFNTPENKQALNNFVALHNAMQKVREDRGFFWKIFHPIQNHREKKFFETLETQKKSYEGKNFPVSDTLEALSSSKILAKHSAEVSEYKNTLQAQKLNEIEKVESQSKEVIKTNNEEKERINVTEANTDINNEISTHINEVSTTNVIVNNNVKS